MSTHIYVYIYIDIDIDIYIYTYMDIRERSELIGVSDGSLLVGFYKA